MDAIILHGHKFYNYFCFDCDWEGTEDELDCITNIHLNHLCCPKCKSNDVSVLNIVKDKN